MPTVVTTKDCETAKDGVTRKDGQRPLAPLLVSTKAMLSAVGLPAWARNALLISAGSVVADVALHGFHGGGSWLGLGALAGGWWWLANGQLNHRHLAPPTTVESWSTRCQTVLSQFPALEPEAKAQATRAAELQELLNQRDRKDLRLALVSSAPLSPSQLPSVQRALQGTRALQLVVSEPLPTKSPRWQWSPTFAACDALMFHLQPPLMAADLRWLEALPSGLPLWILLETGSHPSPYAVLEDFCSQWPAANVSQVLGWSGDADQLTTTLAPLAQWLDREGGRIHQTTLCRCLEQLHGRWQADLERLRRVQWRQLQRRTQWLVAAGVLLTPAMSLDLLVLTAANGLMLREMARLWDCPWTLEQLNAAAMHVGKAALVLGVVEWSSQAFATAFQLHGTTWLVGGTLQALSAAYLTRVIGHAMADLMARSVGVSEPDLDAIKAEAPLLVAKAAEAERLDWGAFLQEAQGWLRQQEHPPQSQIASS